MEGVRVHINESGINLLVDDQHLSRLSVQETADLIVQVLVFCRPIREKVKHWLRDGGPIENTGELLSPSLSK